MGNFKKTKNSGVQRIFLRSRKPEMLVGILLSGITKHNIMILKVFLLNIIKVN